MTNKIQPFHLAMPVSDLAKTRQFYGEFLGFEEGRSNEQWIDWNFFGHQFVTHLHPQKSEQIVNAVDGHGVPVLAQQSEAELIRNKVDGHEVPVPHFGVVLEWQQWHEFAEKLKAAKIKFVIEPYIRFKGKIGEQATMFFLDPSGNALEFKAFQDPSQLFAKYE
jgi:uncharacterized protein